MGGRGLDLGLHLGIFMIGSGHCTVSIDVMAFNGMHAHATSWASFSAT